MGETMVVMMSLVVKASSSTEVVERVRSAKPVVQVAYTVLEGQGDCCRNEVCARKSWLVRGRYNSCPTFRVELPRPFSPTTHSRTAPMWMV